MDGPIQGIQKMKNNMTLPEEYLKTPVQPDKCPICGLDNLFTYPLKNIYGRRYDYILELHNHEAEMILIRGWYCSNGINKEGVFGTVLAYKINEKCIEVIEPDKIFIITEKDRIYPY